MWSDSESDDDSEQDIDENMVFEEILLIAGIVREIDLVQYLEFPSDTQCGWGVVDGQPLLMDFIDKSGLTCDIPDDCYIVLLWICLSFCQDYVAANDATNKLLCKNNRLAILQILNV